MNLKYRLDNRSISQFKKDIKNRTKKEKFLVDLFKKESEIRGHTISIVDNGIDNSGKLITKIANCQPDYKITIDNITGLYEVKCSPVETRCTFKIHSLKKYVKYKSNILLFYNVGYIDTDLRKFKKKDARWAIISTDKISKLLELPSYIEPMFGNKPCVKILQKDYKRYFKSYVFQIYAN